MPCASVPFVPFFRFFEQRTLSPLPYGVVKGRAATEFVIGLSQELVHELALRFQNHPQYLASVEERGWNTDFFGIHKLCFDVLNFYTKSLWQVHFHEGIVGEAVYSHKFFWVNQFLPCFCHLDVVRMTKTSI